MRAIRMAFPEDVPDILASFPPVAEAPPRAMALAFEDGRLIGLLGLDWSDGRHVQAGPILLAPGYEQARWVVLRLVEEAEGFLARAGVQSYIFSTPESNIPLRRVAEKIGARPYAAAKGLIWYEREVNGYVQS